MSGVRGPIAFTGGGTGGHIYPGLAVARSLRKLGYSGRVLWIGSTKELDRRIVEHEGLEYFAIPSGKLRRSFSFENIADAFRVISGYAAARRILGEARPSVLFSKGGYVSVPPCRAAAGLGIPYLTHESDASCGLATRLNSAKAEKILVSWPETLASLPANLAAKGLAVGNPVRESLFSGDASRARANLGVPESLPLILFLGGSQGSRQINDLVAQILPSFEGRAFIVHQTGAGLHDPEIHKPIPGFYAPLPYIGEELGDILAASHIVAGRAGAGTVWECAALGKPLVLIPLAGSGTRGDQVDNAQLAAKAGAASCLVGEKASSDVLVQTLARYLDDEVYRNKAVEAGLRISRVSRPDGKVVLSSDYIAELVLATAARHEGAQA